MSRKISWRAGVAIAAALAVPFLGAPMVMAETPDPAEAYFQQQVNWGDCSWARYLPAGSPKTECATITVPRDWANPGAGPSLKVAISRVKATDTAHRKGMLFTNPGGPGGNGVPLPPRIAEAAPKVSAQYDIIGMDPRGVYGLGTDPLLCDADLDDLPSGSYDSRDLSKEAFANEQQFAKLIADWCAKNPLTPYINTWQTTHDMDLVRALLGEAKLNYLGYSYGSWLGPKYAALFPANTGKVIADSNTAWVDDLANTWQAMPLGATRRVRTQYEAWVSRSSVWAPLLGSTPAQVDALYEKIRAAQVTADGFGWIDSLLFVGQYNAEAYYDFVSEVLAWAKGIYLDGATDAALQDVAKQTLGSLPNARRARVTSEIESTLGVSPSKITVATVKQKLPSVAGPDRLRSLYASLKSQAPATGNTVQFVGTFYAVRCGDGGQWHSPDWWANFTAQAGPPYPIGGYFFKAEPCSFWTPPAQALPNPDPNKVSSIVVVQNELDPATIYENTNRVVAGFRNTKRISVNDGGNHGVFAIGGNGCVDDIVNAYLLDDVTPAAETVCSGLPLPGEDTVYPVTGPVDGKGTPRSTRATLVDPQTQQALQDIINDAAFGKQRKS